jgi:nitrilase
MRNQQKSPFKVAVAQVAPVFLDREATIEKACALIAEAGKNGARLLAFPESFIPCYPDWVWNPLPPGSSGTIHDELYRQLLENSVTVPSHATDRLCSAARKAGVYVVIGVSERNAEASGTSMYNTLVTISAEGEILGKHRKLVPTSGERLVWAQGDGSTLKVYDTSLGRLGGLICWENYMPLARYALYAWGAQIYVAATWDCGEVWVSTLRHIAKEGRVYVLGACIAMTTSDIPHSFTYKKELYGDEGWVNIGNSAIVDPDGNFLAGPVEKTQEILYAEIDPKRMDSSRRMLDVAGHYARPDVFELIVHTEPHRSIHPESRP